MASRSEVIKVFKALHKTRNIVFQGDEEMLNRARRSINENFRQHKDETDPEAIRKLLDEAVEVENVMRTKLLQAVEVKPGYHKIKVRPENCIPNEDTVSHSVQTKEKESR